MRFFWLTFIFLLLHQLAFSQGTCKLYGMVTDSLSGEKLISATIYCKDKKLGITCNNYGFFSILVPSGQHTIVISYVGYSSKEISVFLDSDKEILVQLIPASKALAEVIISGEANQNGLKSMGLGIHRLNMNIINSIPSLGGEPDILKSLQLLPGVQSTNEGTTGLNVQGGSFDQNLILVDEAPLYNPSHALGFVSTINARLINDVVFYKGDFPAKYGGRASSVIDVHLREGNNQKVIVNSNIGLLMSDFSIEGPIKQNKSSFIIAGRYSYADILVNALANVINSKFSNGNRIYFYDLNAKMNWNLNVRNQIYFSAYNGYDHFYMTNIDKFAAMNWGNTTATLRWNHRYSPSLFANTSLIYSDYKFSQSTEIWPFMNMWETQIRELNLKHDIEFYQNNFLHHTFGINLEGYQLFPGDEKIFRGDTLKKSGSLETEKFMHVSAYWNTIFKLNENLSLSFGLRYSIFGLFGTGYSYTYDAYHEFIKDSVWVSGNHLASVFQKLEPRISLLYAINERNSIKGAYTRVNQPIQLLSNTSVSLPTDVWMPADQNTPPITSDIFTIGYFRSLDDKNSIFVSVEAYEKRIQNVIDFIDNAELLMNKELPTQLRIGNAKAYGLEFMLEKKKGKFNGWISYTWSHVMQSTPGINQDKQYPPGYEKPHNLSIIMNLDLSNKWSVNALFKLSSGGYATLPAGSFIYNGSNFNYYTLRNGYELPIYHRLDISVKFVPDKNKNHKWKGEWNFGIYNIYARKNVFALYSDVSSYQFSITKIYLFTFVPFINYSIRF
jgi:CarboxypepD_reg-like domain/TonB dependent receptor/TonB-dependent Receptor Plug Domain